MLSPLLRPSSLHLTTLLKRLIQEGNQFRGVTTATFFSLRRLTASPAIPIIRRNLSAAIAAQRSWAPQKKQTWQGLSAQGPYGQAASRSIGHGQKAALSTSSEESKKEPAEYPKEHMTRFCPDDLDGIYIVPHFRHPEAKEVSVDARMPHPVWSADELETQVSPHFAPKGITDAAAFATVRALRVGYDLFTGYTFGFRDEACYLRRVMVLETIAGVPGMVGAMIRHLSSLRNMERDNGWIHTLLEEAENERMHLMIALQLRRPSLPVRLVVLAGQLGFLSWYSLMYTISPKFCHRFVGYLEEEAFKTYTGLVEDIDNGKLQGFDRLAPPGVQRYYELGSTGTLRDVFLAIRADENHHREVNHTFANIGKRAVNPFPPGF